MKTYKYVHLNLLLVIVTVLILNSCKKEEIVIVYSKVSTVSISNITSTSVTVEGSIDSLTSAAHDEFGFCLDTVASPTVYKQKILASGTVQLGTYSGSITGLIPSRSYHIRAFIKDNNKYLYGKDLQFSTKEAVLPTVTTNYVTDILATTATCGGDVTNEGDKPVLTKGVCYDTVTSPTILKNKTMDGWGTGSFTSSMTDLIPDKTYYARAYAVSEFGVGYGNQRSFNTKEQLYSFREDFNDNINGWYTGTGEYGSAEISDGKYILSYQQPGYLWRVYNNFPDFNTIASKDFEINACIRLSSFVGIEAIGDEMVGGLLWNSDNSHFMFFRIKKTLQSIAPSPSYSYYYQAGTYSGTYTIWKDYTSFTGADTLKLSIKKANSKYYFFINDTQVYSESYETISYNGVGFMIMNSKVKADYLSIEQKDYKKAVEAESVDMKSLPGGNSITKY